MLKETPIQHLAYFYNSIFTIKLQSVSEQLMTFLAQNGRHVDWLAVQLARLGTRISASGFAKSESETK
jgi:hypothetical protein